MIAFLDKNKKFAGGVQNLIINITLGLNEIGTFPKIFGYNGSYIIDSLKKYKAKFLFYDFESITINEIKASLSKNDVLVITNANYLTYHVILKYVNTRVVFWNVFPNDLTDLNKIKSFHFKLLSTFYIKYLLVTDSIYFMDMHVIEAVNETYKLKIPIDNLKLYLPIPVKFNNTNYFILKNKIGNKDIHITYIGRAEVWKMQPLKKILMDLSQIKSSKRFVLHIITQESETYKSFLRNIDHASIEILYHIDFVGEELDSFLIHTSDIHFGMGTSCLEAAKYGIPSILMNYGSEAFPKFIKYSWLFNAKGYSLGSKISHHFSDDALTMEELISIYEPNNIKVLNDISVRIYNYVKLNHNIQDVTKKLFEQSSVAKGNISILRILDINNYCLIKLSRRLCLKHTSLKPRSLS